MNPARHGLVFVPYIYTGWGSSHTPIAIASEFPRVGHSVTAFVPSARARPPAGLDVRSWLPATLPRAVRGGRLHRMAYPAIVKQLLAEVRRQGRGCPVWLWPCASLDTVRALKDAGAFVLREMINTHQSTLRAVLEGEARSCGLRAPIVITDEAIAAENAELALVDRIVSPSEAVDRSLLEQGVPAAKIYRSHFGWAPDRFPDRRRPPQARGRFVALFVGEISARKGAHLALQAWRAAAIDGEFRLVGSVSPEMAPPLAAAIAAGSVRHVPFTADVSPHYRQANVLFFPTLEEGAPLVCYEAAAFGLPILTGPMGTARFVANGVNGIVVDPHDEAALVNALRSLAGDADWREELALAAVASANAHRWEDAASSRVRLLENENAAASADGHD